MLGEWFEGKLVKLLMYTVKLEICRIFQFSLLNLAYYINLLVFQCH
jgi:hypothetical protein